MNKQTKIKITLAKVFIILFAVFIAELVGMYYNQPGPAKHQQRIVGPHAPGQIPDSTSVDSNDNTTYYFKPISND